MLRQLNSYSGNMCSLTAVLLYRDKSPIQNEINVDVIQNMNNEPLGTKK